MYEYIEEEANEEEQGDQFEIADLMYDVKVACAMARWASKPVLFAALAKNLPKAIVSFDVRSECLKFDRDTPETPLWLLPLDKLDEVPLGTPLVALDGDVVLKGYQDIDLDVRGGYLAWGFLEGQFEE